MKNFKQCMSKHRSLGNIYNFAKGCHCLYGTCSCSYVLMQATQYCSQTTRLWFCILFSQGTWCKLWIFNSSHTVRQLVIL